MSGLTIFYLPGCPYCANARRALAELCAGREEYAAVPVEWIDESEEYELAESYDYYYVPSAYLGREKLFEARPLERYAACREKLRAALDRALAQRED